MLFAVLVMIGFTEYNRYKIRKYYEESNKRIEKDVENLYKSFGVRPGQPFR